MLTPQQIKTIESTLIARFGKDDISYDSSKKKFTAAVEIPQSKEDRAYRKSVLVELNKTFQQYGSTYTIPGQGKTGAVKISGISIEVKKKLTAKSIKKSGLKPIDIVPSIVNDWYTPEQIVKNVQMYISKQDFSPEIEKELYSLLDATIKDKKLTIPFNVKKDLIPPEFFEVLSSVKLGVLLKSEDPMIRRVLGIPKEMPLRNSKIRIWIPQKANEPLIDFYIDISTGTNSTIEDSLKISVKSKIAGEYVNTVKFIDIFKTEKDVNDWYKSLNSGVKPKQKGQKIISENAILGYNRYRGKTMGSVPILSIYNLIKEDKTKITKIISKFKNIDMMCLEKYLKVVVANLSSAKYTTPLSEYIGQNGITESEFIKIQNAITSNIVMRGNKIPEISVWNLAHLCEKFLEQSAMEGSPTNYNFYQIFFDEVLKKKNIAYAVTTKDGNNVKFNFYTKINYEKEYKNWIGLRSKNSANQPNDVIGLEA
jgi:hypothetical protein